MSTPHHTSPRTRPARFAQLLALLTIVAVLIAACASDDDESGADDSGTEASFDSGDSDDGGDDMAEEEDAADEGDTTTTDRDGAAAEPAEGGESLAQGTALTPADLGRDIIFRAEIGVEVVDVAAAGAEATQRIEALGGVVFGQTTVIEPSPRTVLIFKVAPADFDDALAQLGGVGDLVDQTITADDVTERVVDLQSRVLTAETSVERLREFLAGAQTVQDVADLERELVARELELESLRGQLRTLQDQVSLATITLTITEAGPETAEADVEVLVGLGADRDAACPGAIELETARDDDVVWCVEIENVGEATLGQIELRSEALGLRTRDFTVIEGDVDVLEPGDVVRLVVDLDVEDGRIRRRDARSGIRLDVVVDVVPTDDLERTLSVDRSALVFADDEEALPGFRDSFDRGVGVLAWVGSVLLVLLGGVLPFVPIIAIGAFAVRLVRRRRPPAPSIEE